MEKISELVPFFSSFLSLSLSLSKKENNTIELHANEYFLLLLAGIPYNVFTLINSYLVQVSMDAPNDDAFLRYFRSFS